MGASLAKVIMMECEKLIVVNLVKEGAIKFYVSNINDTLLLFKRQDKVFKTI